jgi:hypothetical protein
MLLRWQFSENLLTCQLLLQHYYTVRKQDAVVLTADVTRLTKLLDAERRRSLESLRERDAANSETARLAHSLEVRTADDVHCFSCTFVTLQQHFSYKDTVQYRSLHILVVHSSSAEQQHCPFPSSLCMDPQKTVVHIKFMAFVSCTIEATRPHYLDNLD